MINSNPALTNNFSQRQWFSGSGKSKKTNSFVASSSYAKDPIFLKAANQKLYIGAGNVIPTNYGVVYKGSILQPDLKAKDIIAAPVDGYKFNLTNRNVATEVNIGPLAIQAKRGHYLTTVQADNNDTLRFSQISGTKTEIDKVSKLRDGKVAVNFRVTRDNDADSSNTVRVIATKEDMNKLLSSAEGLSPEALKQAKADLEDAGISTKASVKKTGEERGKVSPEVAESALNSRAIMYGKDHKINENFIKYRNELETGGYTVTEGADGKYKVTRKATETSSTSTANNNTESRRSSSTSASASSSASAQEGSDGSSQISKDSSAPKGGELSPASELTPSNDNVPIVPVGTELKYA